MMKIMEEEREFEEICQYEDEEETEKVDGVEEEEDGEEDDDDDDEDDDEEEEEDDDEREVLQNSVGPPVQSVDDDEDDKEDDNEDDDEDGDDDDEEVEEQIHFMGILKTEPVLLSQDNMNDDEVENSDVEVSESESEDEDVKLAEPSKNSIYNKDGLLDKLGDISWPDNVEWIHKLTLDINQEQEVDVNDDLARELAFYTQALEGTRQAFVKFQSMGLPFLRPPDYYAEMVKTDAHMVKVKGRLLAEKRKIEEADERRKARESKKIAKEVQAQKLKERAKQKKDEIESIKKWRKQRQQSGFAGGDKDVEIGLTFEHGKLFEKTTKRRPGVAPFDRSGGKASRVGGGKGKGKGAAGGKRKGKEFKDSKFGFAGRKGLKKQNTAETTNDFRSFDKSKSSGNKKRKR